MSELEVDLGENLVFVKHIGEINVEKTNFPGEIRPVLKLGNWPGREEKIVPMDLPRAGCENLILPPLA